MKHTIVIVGLGLIGGSLALALKGFEDFEVVGVDVSQPTLRYAREHAVADRVCEDAAAVLGQADVVALALHPQGIVDFLSAYRDQFKPGALVWDVCGVKSAVMQAAQVLPASVDFIGCHPMAGTEFSGIEHAPTSSCAAARTAPRNTWPCWNAWPPIWAFGTYTRPRRRPTTL